MRFFKRGRLLNKNTKPLPGTQKGRTQNLGQKQVYRQKPRSNFQISMSGATDPIKPGNPSFYSFGLFWAINKKIAKLY